MARRYSKILANEDCSPEALRKEFSQELIDAYVKLVMSDFSDKEHEKYSVLAETFLGIKYKDLTERGKLIVRLNKATCDLVNKHEKAKKQKASPEETTGF